MEQVDCRPVNLAFSDYAQKDFDTPPARWRGFRRITGGANRSASTLGDADAFANAGIEGLFANIGFSGLWDLRFVSGACGQMGGEGQIGPIGMRRGEMLAREAFAARPVPTIGAGNERQW
jgi:hypothetical protein